MSTSQDDIEIAKEYLADMFLDLSKLERVVEESAFSKREYLAYVLAEESDLTGAESAELMGIAPGTYWGKLGRARNKIEEAEITTGLVRAP
jgi:predicted DNA-binding protein (UPF0251 family)